MSTPPPRLPDDAALREAADWAIAFQYGTPSEAERQAFELWRRQSPVHEAAWARAQAVFGAFGQVAGGVGKAALDTLARDKGRRRSLRRLAVLLLAVPAGGLAWRQLPWHVWRADVATATGQRRTLTLPDGSQLALNTASAVDIAFDATVRRLRLVAGEVLVTTHADPAPVFRPFVVDTPQGTVQALGTRFSVRRLDDETVRVAVFEHAVAIHPPGGGAPVRLQAGQQTDLGRDGIATSGPVGSSAALWAQGMLLAQDMPLAAVVAELGRHRSGVLRCDPAVAGLRVSGAMSLDDTDAALAQLAQSLPLRIEYRSRYWVTVTAR